jgi:beta-galactosidase/beta-glucuronidase
MSEFGFQGLPPIETIRTYADETEWNMTSYVMDLHQKNASGNSLMVGQMLDMFQMPKDFVSLVYLSMARTQRESWRRTSVGSTAPASSRPVSKMDCLVAEVNKSPNFILLLCHKWQVNAM